MTAIVDLILFLVFPSAAYHGCVALLLAKMYSNSLMVLLNSRIRIIGSRSESYSMEDSHHSVHLNKSRPGAAIHLTSRNAAVNFSGVHVQEETWTRTDGDVIPMEDRVSIFIRYRLFFISIDYVADITCIQSSDGTKKAQSLA